MVFNENTGSNNLIQIEEGNLPFASLFMNVDFLDIDFDGIKEMILGKYNGRISVYKIETNNSYPVYNLINSFYCDIHNWNGIDPGKANVSSLYINGIPYLSISTALGNIHYYPIHDTTNACQEEEVLATTDIDIKHDYILSNNKSLLISGNLRGGVELYAILNTTTSVLEINNSPFVSIFPNPILKNNLLKIKTNQTEIEYRITDLSGKIVLKGSTKEIKIPSQLKGIYFIQILSKAKLIRILKLIIL